MSSNYYQSVILATRDSARALARMIKWNRLLSESRSLAESRAIERKYQRARRDYARAQEILDSHPLSAEDIAARQADAPRAR